MTERAEHKKYLQDHDQSLLDLADDQDEKHHLFKMKTQYERKEKTIRNVITQGKFSLRACKTLNCAAQT